jgi:hypothetical protein
LARTIEVRRDAVGPSISRPVRASGQPSLLPPADISNLAATTNLDVTPARTTT